METTMLQQVMTAPGEIRFERVPVPQAGPGQVLVKIKRIGICGSDIHVYHGKHPYTSYPVTQGHEVSGQIAALGEGVTDLRVGQRVTIEPQVFCGKCYPCTHGKYNLCESLKVMGFQTTGTASKYFAVDQSKVDLLPEGMGFDEGAMIEPLAVTVHAARRAGDVRGLRVCVLGCGPIGILLIQSLKALGADVIALSCTGMSTIVLVAVFAGQARCDLAKLNDSELDLNTSMMYRHEDYVDAIRLVGEGKIQLRPLMSKHFAFQDYLAAYQYIDNNRETTMKVLVDVDPSDD